MLQIAKAMHHPLIGPSAQEEQYFAILDANPVFKGVKQAFNDIAQASNGALEVVEVRILDGDDLVRLELRTKDYSSEKKKVDDWLANTLPDFPQDRANEIARRLVKNVATFYSSGEVVFSPQPGYAVREAQGLPYISTTNQASYNEFSQNYVVSASDLALPEISRNHFLTEEADLKRISMIAPGTQTDEGRKVIANIVNNLNVDSRAYFEPKATAAEVVSTPPFKFKKTSIFRTMGKSRLA